MRKIYTIKDIQKIGNDPDFPLDGDYVLTQDIDASDTVRWNGGSGFDPIGGNTNCFTGTLYGQGYSITNLFINRPNTNYVGLFGIVGHAGKLCGIELRSATVTGRQAVGGLCGWNWGTIIDSYTLGYEMDYTSTITGEFDIGGLCGWNEGAIVNTRSVSVVSGIAHVGGVVGTNFKKGYVYKALSACTIKGHGSIGGIAGRNWGIIIRPSSSSCHLDSKGEHVGEIVGSNHADETDFPAGSQKG